VIRIRLSTSIGLVLVTRRSLPFSATCKSVDELVASIGENWRRCRRAFRKTVGHRFVGERPETFGRLELWRVGWQKGKTHARRNRQSCAATPSGIVEDENDAVLFSAADGLGEVLRQFFKERLADPVGHRRLDEGSASKKTSGYIGSSVCFAIGHSLQDRVGYCRNVIG
jgi:hypothetical protein